MTILQLAPQNPYPATDGGKVSIWNVSRQFTLAGHTVHAVVYGTKPLKDHGIPNLTIHQVNLSTRNTPWRIAKSLFRSSALFIHKNETEEYRAKVDEVFRNHHIDVIHADHTSMGTLAQWAARKYGVPWGLRLHNVEWIIWQRYCERFPRWHPIRWYTQSQAKKLRWDEADIIRAAPVAFPISEVDKLRAAELAPSTPFVVAPGGVEVPESLLETPEKISDLVIASSWKWVHNVEGLRWFLSEVWPIVRTRLPDATFSVLGIGVPDWVKEYQTVGVCDEGFVEDLFTRLQQSSVYVAPLFVGSGIRFKALEGLGCGLPVVATTVGAEGIEIGEECGLYRRDDAASTAEQIITLLQDGELRSNLRVKASRAVFEQYSAKYSVGKMLQAYTELVRQGSM